MTEEQQLHEDLQMISSGMLMERFTQDYCNSTPNIVFPTLGGNTFWNTIYEIDGWKIQKHDFIHNIAIHYRILDPQNMRRAWTMDLNETVNTFAYNLHRFADLLRDEKRNLDRRYGIVFSGGGGKGAYQIGVWKYLHEIGIAPKITGVSGASVGALNSLLFLQGDYEKAHNIWMNVGQGDFTYFDIEQCFKILKSLAFLCTSPIQTFSSEIIDFLKNPLNNTARSLSFFSQSRLEEIICKYVNGDTIVKNLKQKEVYSSLFTLPNGPYYPAWSGRTFKQIRDLILTSAALPLIYPIRSYDGRYCIDGGMADNIPVKPLLNNYDHIIVVHLTPKSQEQFAWKQAIKGADTSGKQFYHVYPSTSKMMSTPVDTFTINPTITHDRIALGYQDAANQLQVLAT